LQASQSSQKSPNCFAPHGFIIPPCTVTYGNEQAGWAQISGA
jgi:hypothetical protein